MTTPRYFTNAVKCYPCDGAGNSREPTATERENCRPYPRTELDRIDPAVVVPTGKHATRSVLALAVQDIDDVADGFLDAVLAEVVG